jgi:hypothetical protein
MNKLLYPLLPLLLLSCKSKSYSGPLSDIEVIKFDPKVTDSLFRISDSSFRQPFGDSGTWDTYINRKDSTKVQIFKDDEGYIEFNKSRNDDVIFSAQYYPNGQLRHTVNMLHIVDGYVRYYYEDGRVRVEGYKKNGFSIGVWKEYDEKGRLTSTKESPTRF